MNYWNRIACLRSLQGWYEPTIHSLMCQYSGVTMKVRDMSALYLPWFGWTVELIGWTVCISTTDFKFDFKFVYCVLYSMIPDPLCKHLATELAWAHPRLGYESNCEEVQSRIFQLRLLFNWNYVSHEVHRPSHTGDSANNTWSNDEHLKRIVLLCPRLVFQMSSQSSLLTRIIYFHAPAYSIFDLG